MLKIIRMSSNVFDPLEFEMVGISTALPNRQAVLDHGIDDLFVEC